MTRPAPIARHPFRTAPTRLALAASLLFALSAPAAATTVITDPVGDLVLLQDPLPAGAPVIPDIIEVTGGFTPEDLLLTATFAPGTMTPGTEGYFFTFGLDLDLDDSTGSNFLRGADHVLLVASSFEFATVCDDLIPLPLNCGLRVPVTAEADYFELAFPLGPGGLEDDGVLRFGLATGVFFGLGPIAGDEAWDGTARQDRVLSAVTSAVPEPGLGSLLAIGLLGIALRRRVA